MKYTTILFTVLLLASMVRASTIEAKDTTAAEGSKATVSLYVSGVTKLGAMDLKVQYDPQVLQFKGASLGDASSNGLIESKDSGNGVAMISFADTKGISADGELVVLSFDVTGKAGSSTKISLDARAYGTDLKDMPIDVKAGNVQVVAGKVPPVTKSVSGSTGTDNTMLYMIAGAVVLIIVVAVVVVKSKKKK